ncbi:hypothetical protein Ccrd_010108, partial [Cynara cardunculus var. scolymus]
ISSNYLSPSSQPDELSVITIFQQSVEFITSASKSIFDMTGPTFLCILVFSERRGQWKAATQSQEFFRTLQRYYNNAYMDAEKQNAINVFLGHFQPQDGKPEVWELDSDQHFSAYRNGCSAVDKDGRSLHKKSLSDGNIIRESKLPTSSSNIGKSFACSALSDRSPGESKMIFGSKPEISTCDSGLTCSREPFGDLHNDGSLDEEKSHSVDCSNFVDLDWLSSSLNSCEEQLLGRSLFARSSMAGLSPENAANEIAAETTPSTSESSIKGSKHTAMESLCDDYDLPEEFSDSFLRWINNGETLCH